jgi:starch-binding outer membrane protein, SusD/RagB family
MIANASNTIRQALLGSALALGLVLPACDILDVNNPNSVKEEDLAKIAAASALVNGAVAANWRATSNVWLGYLMATDEIVWIGSRDAWGQLDQGFIANPANEFTNAAYPLLGQARWMADLAASQMDAHVDSVPTIAMKTQQARAYLMAGMIYMLVGEVQEDFVLGDKQVADPPLGPTKMSTILDQAILKLDKALTVATEVNNDSLITRTLALRARAKHSRALWDKIKPTIAAQPLVSSTGASADAAAVLARNGVNVNWRFQLTFSSASLNNFMASEINSRGEQQFDTTSVVSVNKAAPKTILSVKLMDPLNNRPDPRILAFLQEWKTNPNIGVPGEVYAPLTIVSAKHMRLILAEDELAKGNTAGFTTHINAVRAAADSLAPYSGQIPAIDMLKHERRAVLFVTGVRLIDMYRFGIRDPLWHANSDTRNKPGMLLPITCRELDANPNLTPC